MIWYDIHTCMYTYTYIRVCIHIWCTCFPLCCEDCRRCWLLAHVFARNQSHFELRIYAKHHRMLPQPNVLFGQLLQSLMVSPGSRVVSRRLKPDQLTCSGRKRQNGYRSYTRIYARRKHLRRTTPIQSSCLV